MDPNWPNNIHQQLPIINYIQTSSVSQTSSSSTNSSLSLQHNLRRFWEKQRHEIEENRELCKGGHSLPLSRIKKIMKLDEQVRMVSAEAPVLLSKACDIFIQDLTLRSWSSTEECRRRTLQKADITAAVSTTDLFDFLVDIVPKEKPLVSNNFMPAVRPIMVMGGGNNEGVLHGQPRGLPMQLMPSTALIDRSWSGLARQNDWVPPDI